MLRRSLNALLVLLLLWPATAAAWPDKSVKNLCGWAPGGGADLQGRLIEKAWAEEFGHPLTFIYKTGANGAIVATELATSRPDGYAIAPFSLPHLVTNLLTGKGQYNLKDLTFLGEVCHDAVYLAVSKESPITTLEQFVAHARANKLNVGSIDIFGSTHFGALKLYEKDVPYAIVGFGGGPKTISALLGNQVDAMFGMTGSVMASLSKMRLLAIAAPERLPDFPDVPTFRELGYDIVEMQSRLFIARAGMKPDVKKRLTEGLRAIMARPDVREAFIRNAMVPDFIPGDEVERRLAERMPEIERLTKLGMSLGQ